MSIPLSPETTRHLARLAQKLRADSAYMSSVLFFYQSQERLGDTELATQLALDVVQLPRLALCKRPQSQSNNFSKQVRQIAAYTGANEIALAQIIRQVEALEQLRSLPTLAETEANERPLPSLSGLVAVARDREEPNDESRSDDELNDKGEIDS
jgi:hypothetical protein